MGKDLSEVPGYARSIVLVGWPADDVPDLRPHNLKIIGAGLASVLQHHDDLLSADLVVFHSDCDLLHPPATDDELATIGAVCRGSQLGQTVLASRPKVTDLTIGKELLAEHGEHLRNVGLDLLRSLMTEQLTGQVFGACVIVFLPAQLPNTGDSVWKHWLGLPEHQGEPVLFEQDRNDPHTVSFLYYLSILRQLAQPSDEGLATKLRGALRPEELAHGVISAVVNRSAVFSGMTFSLPAEFAGTPLIHSTGGLVEAVQRVLPDDHTVRINGLGSGATDKEPVGAEISSVLALAQQPCRAVRVRIGQRDTFVLGCLRNNSPFLKEVVTYLYRYGLSTLSNDAEYALPEGPRWARGKVESRMGSSSPIIGESAGILSVYHKLLESFENPRDPILIYGPIGAGKEVLFDTLKQLAPGRDMMVVDVTGLESTSMITNLFGHVKGAYTGATEDRKGAVETVGYGTLIIDNFQNVSKEAQAKLLRLLEKKGEYQRFGSDRIKTSNARIVIAMNKDPQQLVDEGSLLPDLISRFPIKITIPPLNDRRVDIPLLVEAFHRECLKENQWDQQFGNRLSVAPLVHGWMKADWSGSAGNVRGLKNAVLSAMRAARHALLILAESEGTLPTSSVPATPDQEAAGKRSPGRPRGRPSGRNVRDEDLTRLIFEATSGTEYRSVDWLFAQLDKHRQDKSRPMTRSQGALRERVRNIADDAVRTECMRRLDALHGYADLPRSRPSK